MTCRVEWTNTDHTGAEHRYVSHDMPQRDAEAMARTLREAGARDVAVLQNGR